MQQIFRKQP